MLAGADAARRALLQWYEPRRSAYPWRTTNDPYAVLVSEVMLQQTQVTRVVPAFERFLGAFPTVDRLEAAAVGEVVRAWNGLGYNRRAVSLHRAAGVVVSVHAGVVPAGVPELCALPGVGPYTAAAVASIAYGVPVAAVDTNASRVVSRVCATTDPSEVATATHRLLDRREPGAWNQAVMDLGRLVCRPRPRCESCPLRSTCRSAGRDVERPSRRGGEAFEGSSRQLRGGMSGFCADVDRSPFGPSPMSSTAIPIAWGTRSARSTRTGWPWRARRRWQAGRWAGSRCRNPGPPARWGRDLGPSLPRRRRAELPGSRGGTRGGRTMALTHDDPSGMSWGGAAVRAAIVLVVSVVAFMAVPDRLLAYLSLHVAPGVRDVLVTIWIVVAFVGVAALFVRVQRGRSA